MSNGRGQGEKLFYSKNNVLEVPPPSLEKCTTKRMPLHVSAKLHIATSPRFRKKPFYVKLKTFSTA